MQLQIDLFEFCLICPSILILKDCFLGQRTILYFPCAIALGVLVVGCFSLVFDR